MFKHWRIGLIGAAVSALAVVFIFTQLNVQQFLDVLRLAQYTFVVPCVVLLLLGLAARAVRWRLLLDGKLLLRRSFSIMNVAYLVNNLLPLRIGELARIYLAARAEPAVPPLQSGSTIVVERLLDLLAVVILLAFALATAPLPVEYQTTGIFMGVVSVTGFGILIFFAGRRTLAMRIADSLTERIPFLRRLNPHQRLNEVLAGLAPLTGIRTLLSVFGWTVLSWGFSVLAGYILMFAFYPQASWTATALYIAAAAFAIAVPAVPGNVGPYELSIILALGAVGYGEPAEIALAFAVLVHGVNVLVHAVTGVLGLMDEGISLGQLSRGVRQMRTQQNQDVVEHAS